MENYDIRNFSILQLINELQIAQSRQQQQQVNVPVSVSEPVSEPVLEPEQI